MSTQKRNETTLTNLVLCLYCLIAIVAIMASYEMITVFFETVFNTVRELNVQDVQRGFAQY